MLKFLDTPRAQEYFRKIQEILSDHKPHNLREIADIIGVTRPCITPYVHHLHEQRTIRIGAWFGPKKPSYVINPNGLADEPAPERLPNAEASRRYRERVRQDPERLEKYLAMLKRRYDSIMADPERRKRYKKNMQAFRRRLKRDPERQMQYEAKKKAAEIKPRQDFFASWFNMKVEDAA